MRQRQQNRFIALVRASTPDSEDRGPESLGAAIRRHAVAWNGQVVRLWRGAAPSRADEEAANAELESREAAICRHAADRNGRVVRLWRVAATASLADEEAAVREMIAYARRTADRLNGVLLHSIMEVTRQWPLFVALHQLEDELGLPLVAVGRPFENSPFYRFTRRLMIRYFGELYGPDGPDGPAAQPCG